MRGLPTLGGQGKANDCRLPPCGLRTRGMTNLASGIVRESVAKGREAVELNGGHTTRGGKPRMQHRELGIGRKLTQRSEEQLRLQQRGSDSRDKQRFDYGRTIGSVE